MRGARRTRSSSSYDAVAGIPPVPGLRPSGGPTPCAAQGCIPSAGASGPTYRMPPRRRQALGSTTLRSDRTAPRSHIAAHSSERLAQPGDLVDVDGTDNVDDRELPPVSGDDGESFDGFVGDGDIDVHSLVLVAIVGLDQSAPTGTGQLRPNRLHVRPRIGKVGHKLITANLDRLQSLEGLLQLGRL